MALDSRYIVALDLQEYLVDRDTGLPLSNGYIAFWEDDSRTTPKPVYQLTGAPPNYTYTELPNPVNLSAVGTPVDANGNYTPIYYFPYDSEDNIQLYYISVFSKFDVQQFTLQAWPNITQEDNPATLNNNISNQISNSQFVDVLFVPERGVTISFEDPLFNAEYNIAPDWTLIVNSSGAGSIIVNQVALQGSLNIDTNPPYLITFNISGGTVTNLVLRQTLNNNPDIWSTTVAGEGYISGIMLVTSLDGQPHTLEMQYNQSAGSSIPQVIVSGSTNDTGYNLLNNTILLNPGTNTDDSNYGSVFIDIVLPNTGYFGLTSVQVVGLNNDNTIVQYEQEPANRQKDHLFHYFQPEINFKPIKSYLCGWDFSLNPAQFNGSTVATSANTSFYLWDQTIGFQSVASSLSASRVATGALTGSLQLNVANSCQVAIVQYLTKPQILEILSNRLSSNIVLSSNQSSLVGTISLWYTTQSPLPNINTMGQSIVLTLNSNGKPASTNGVWSEINRSNYGDATFTLDLASSLSVEQSFGFSGWENTLDDIQTVAYFAIVVGFSTLNSGNSIVIKSCSLVPGDIPTIPAPQTADEVLSDCEYYYEKSYESSTLPGTATSTGAIAVTMHCAYDAGIQHVYSTPFSINYKNIKTSNPLVTIYSYLDGSSGNIVFFAAGSTAQHAFTSFFALLSQCTKNITYYQSTSSPALDIPGITFSASGVIIYQYTADCRLGVFST